MYQLQTLNSLTPLLSCEKLLITDNSIITDVKKAGASMLTVEQNWVHRTSLVKYSSKNKVKNRKHTNRSCCSKSNLFLLIDFCVIANSVINRLIDGGFSIASLSMKSLQVKIEKIKIMSKYLTNNVYPLVKTHKSTNTKKALNINQFLKLFPIVS